MRRLLLAVRYLWASPATAVGLLLAATALCGGARAGFAGGVVEVAGGRLSRVRALRPFTRRYAAITLGHVIVAVDHAQLGLVRSHELVHVRQYERWGPLFFPLYAASSAIQLVRGRSPYRDNAFEREAFAGARVRGEASA